VRKAADDRHQINSLLLVGSMEPRIRLIPFLIRMSLSSFFPLPIPLPSSLRLESFFPPNLVLLSSALCTRLSDILRPSPSPLSRALFSRPHSRCRSSAIARKLIIVSPRSDQPSSSNRYSINCKQPRVRVYPLSKCGNWKNKLLNRE
jgi:hypothetical protein